MYRTHPITIFSNMGKLLYLLVIPVARGFVLAWFGSFEQWLAGAGFDILILLIITVTAFMRWRTLLYNVSIKGVTVSRGFIIKLDSFIPLDSVATITVERPPILFHILHAARLRVSTVMSSEKLPDVKLYVKGRHLDNFKTLTDAYKNESKPRVYRPSITSLFILSLISSNSFAGVLLVSSLISQIGAVVGGENIQSQLIHQLDTFSRSYSFGIPPLFALVSYVILFGWIINFIFNLFRQIGFTAIREDKSIKVRRGFLNKKHFTIFTDKINFVEVRQGLISLVFKIYSVFLHCSGFRSDKNDISSVIPATGHGSFESNLSLLLPEFVPAKKTVRPGFGALFRYVGDPVWFSLLSLGVYLLGYLLKRYTVFLNFASAFILLPTLWLAFVRISGFYMSGAGQSEDKSSFTLCYFKGVLIHHVIIPRHKIAMLTLRQSIFQKTDKTCDLVVYSVAATPTKHKVRGVKVSECKELFFS